MSNTSRPRRRRRKKRPSKSDPHCRIPEHSIPEVRTFYSVFLAACPYWLYFCNLDTEELQMMVLCCLPSIAALKVDPQLRVAVKYDRTELLEFLSVGFVSMNAMCERGGMFESRIFERTKSIFEYFQLPFDALPVAGS